MITRISLFLSIVVLLLIPSLAFAQTPPEKNFDVTVSPTFIELSTKPGSAVTQSVRLRNNTNNEIKVKPQVRLMGGNEQGELTIKDTKEAYLNWLTVSQDEVTLKPREWSTVNFTIDVPEDAAFGYYWAITFTSEDKRTNPETGATLTASLAVPVLLSVEKAGAKVEGKFLDFKTDKFYYEYPPVTFTTQFQNNGNVHIRPQGNIFIKDFLGRTVGTLTVNESQGAILPSLNRTYESAWNDGFITYEPKMKDGIAVTNKNGDPEREIKIHYQKLLDLRIGKYTATALMLVSGPDRDYTYEKSISFFVFPWKVILVIIAIVIFVGIGLYTTSRSVFRKVKGALRRK
jgi:hypothetical protein